MGADNTKLKKRPRKARGKLLPLAFIGPHLILFIVFVLFPIIYGVVISFAKWDMIGTPQWVGLDNYKEIYDLRYDKQLKAAIEYLEVGKEPPQDKEEPRENWSNEKEEN